MPTHKELVDLMKARKYDELRQTLQQEPECARSRDSEGVSLLLAAMYNDRPQCVPIILEFAGETDPYETAAIGDVHRMLELTDADRRCINSFSPDGFTPFCLAAYFGQEGMVRLLLDLGADPNLASENDLRVMPLHSALSRGHKEITSLLIREGADVSAAAAGGWTPLHYAADANDIETARLLISNGADTDAVRSDGCSAYQIAQLKGYTDMCDVLVG